MKLRSMPLASLALGLGLLFTAIFAQSALAATAATEAATGVTSYDATLNGTVNPQGKLTSWQFEYGTTTSYGKKAPVEAKTAGSGTTGVKVSESIGLAAQSVSLEPNTTYHYRLVAITGGTTVAGSDVTFTTPRLVGPPTFAFSVGSLGEGNGQFNAPHDIAVGPDGSVWVSDTGNNRIEKFNSAGEFQCKIGSLGSGNGQFNAPLGIAVDPSGHAWVADSNNARIEEISSECGYLGQFGKRGSGDGEFELPSAVAIHPSGDLLVLDPQIGNVQRFNLSGGFVSKFSVGEDYGLAVDEFGDIWTGDPGLSRYREYSGNGKLLYSFQTGAVAYSDIDIDLNGDLWVPLNKVGRLYGFHPDGELIGESEALLKSAKGVAVAPDGDIWVADTGNNRIVKWNPAPRPAVLTGIAKNSLRTGTIFTGFVNPQGVQTSYKFEWGTTLSLGSTWGETGIGSGTSSVWVSAVDSILEPNTTYYYRVTSTSQKGIIYGEKEYFTTQP